MLEGYINKLMPIVEKLCENNKNGGHDRVHLNTGVDWVMYPNMDTVNTAKEKINETMK